ncbi:MAG: hypothetical protein FWD11_11830 [Micrococcales bacterium]|nr:hypothetical protein [Micrococcales bacterium]
MSFWYVEPRTQGRLRGPITVPVSSDGTFTADLPAGEYSDWGPIAGSFTAAANQTTVLTIELDPFTMTVQPG